MVGRKPVLSGQVKAFLALAGHNTLNRHGRTCSDHPRLPAATAQAWMLGTGPSMTGSVRKFQQNGTRITVTVHQIDSCGHGVKSSGMARLARTVLPGIPHHVTQRGNSWRLCTIARWRRQGASFDGLRMRSIEFGRAAGDRT